MSTSALPRPNSTTGRPVPARVRAIRAWFALESKVAPTWAERRAARLFATPPAQHRNTVRRTAASLLSEHARSSDLVIRDGDLTIAASTLGEGPTVMLLHGWGGASTDMLAMAGAFARAGFRSVLFDMPGHGRSSGRQSSLVQFLRAIRTVSRALGAPEVLVGHSFGGSAAVFGVTELGLPVRSAILVSPAPGPAYYIDRFSRAVGLPPERRDGMVRRLVKRVGRPMESLDAIVAARAADVPALILHDPEDREVPWRFASQMAAAWRGSRLVAAPALGHKRILVDGGTIAAAVQFATAS